MDVKGPPARTKSLMFTPGFTGGVSTICWLMMLETGEQIAVQQICKVSVTFPLPVKAALLDSRKSVMLAVEPVTLKPSRTSVLPGPTRFRETPGL